MKQRQNVRDTAVLAWNKTLKSRYPTGSINSERSLQFWFCHYLMLEWEALKLGNFSLFIEPTFLTSESTDSEGRPTGKKTLIPDVVICNSQRIIGVFELKYQPRSAPLFEKDYGTLDWFASGDAKTAAITLKNERYLGEPLAQRVYQLADDAVLCWAGVYKGEQALDTAPAGAGERFLSLHGITVDGRPPQVIPSAPAPKGGLC